MGFLDGLKSMFFNPVCLAGLTSWFSAQFIKTVINLIARRVRSLKELFEILIWRTGGMPSSHTALVCSVCTTIGGRNGVTSDIFILAMCFMFVTIRDAVGVRRSSGVQAKTINEVGKALAKKDLIKFHPIKEVQGHKPLEVVVGAILGISVGAAFSLL